MNKPAVSARKVSKALRALANPEIAAHSQRFFKTGKGEYGEGDRFLGIRVPQLRKQARLFRGLPLAQTRRLLQSRFHEERLCALLILVDQFRRGPEDQRARIYNLYLNNTRFVNNWDLVDSSAHHIIGPYLEDRDRQLLYELADSMSLWERRIAIMSTFHFIKLNQFDDTLKLSQRLLRDEQDLIHKAVGWMLREVGNRKPTAAKSFLKTHYRDMPRTMLRYAIEKFPETERKRYLEGKI